MKYPPPAHYKHFKKTCPCIEQGQQDRRAVLTRKTAKNGSYFFGYRCLTCARYLTDWVPHVNVANTPFVCETAWSFADLTDGKRVSRFSSLKGVLLPSSFRAPAPGEIPPESIVEPRFEQLTYFVDEAGDPNLLGSRRAIIIGKPGCSRSFMIGAASIERCQDLCDDLKELRQQLLADPKLSRIESMKKERRLTAIQFHAAKDHPAVRERVFALLESHKIDVWAVVRRKQSMLNDVLARSEDGPPRYAWEREFDSLVSRLFKDRLHLAKRTDIFISERGSSNRDANLREAIERARHTFEHKWQVFNPFPVSVRSDKPTNHIGLQVVDYYLWALQRVFERGDFKYFSKYRDRFKLVVDVDDRRKSPAGAYFSDSNLLTPDSLKPFEG